MGPLETSMVRRLPAPELFLDARANLAEGPVWDDRTGRLWWVDLDAGRLHSADPSNGETTTLELGKAIGIAVVRASGGLVAALEDGFWAIDDDGGLEGLAPIDTQDGTLRFNDGACDPAGRLLAGNMARDMTPGAGSLYRLDLDRQVTQLLEAVSVSNGLGWSPDGGTLYYADSPTSRIDAFDYDVATGALDRRRPFVRLTPEDGQPDGLCVDEHGGVWVALWDGWSIRRYLPDGRLDTVLPLPVARVSSCAFGGPDLDELYITTAWTGLTPDQRAEQPLAGSLFRTKVGVRGLPVEPYRG